MVNIIQISDLHFGSGKEFQIKCMENVIQYIEENQNIVDMVICTGDLVHKGRPYQYEGLIPFLDRIRAIKPFMIIPGNHDVKNSGLLYFETQIGPRRSTMLFEEKDTIVVGLCSAKDDLSDGEIGDEQLLWLAKQFNSPMENRVIALHHHLISVPYSGRKFSIVHDAGELIEFTHLFEIDLVLMGHKHIPHAYTLGNTVFLYCGTSTSNKVRAMESPSFNHINLDEGNLEVQIVNSKTLEKNLLISKDGGEVTFIRPRKTRIEHIINSKLFE